MSAPEEGEYGLRQRKPGSSIEEAWSVDGVPRETFAEGAAKQRLLQHARAAGLILAHNLMILWRSVIVPACRWVASSVSASYAARTAVYVGADDVIDTGSDVRVFFRRPLVRWCLDHAVQVIGAASFIFMLCFFLTALNTLATIKNEASRLSAEHYEDMNVARDAKRVFFAPPTIDLVEFQSIEDAARHAVDRPCRTVDVRRGALDVVLLGRDGEPQAMRYTTVRDVIEVHMDVMTRSSTKARFIMPKLWNLTTGVPVVEPGELNPCVVSVKFANGTLVHMVNPTLIVDVHDATLNALRDTSNVAEMYGIYPFLLDEDETPLIVAERHKHVHVRYRTPDGLVVVSDLSGVDAYIVQMAMNVADDGVLPRARAALNSTDVVLISRV